MTEVQQKPNENASWAEEGPPSSLGSSLPVQPSDNFIQKGYGFKQPLPHNEFNWLFRTVMRWIRWLVSKVDFHVHDGGNDPKSVAKVNANDHLDWGINGSLIVTVDNEFEHGITHAGSAPNRSIVTGELTANQRVVTQTIESPGTSVNVMDADGQPGLIDAAIVRCNVIRSKDDDGTINLRDKSSNNTVTLDVKNLNTSTIKLDKIISKDDFIKRIKVESPSQSEVTLNVHMLEAKNVAIAAAVVLVFPNVAIFESNTGIALDDYRGFSNDIEYVGVGDYKLKLAEEIILNNPNLINIKKLVVLVVPQSTFDNPIFANYDIDLSDGMIDNFRINVKIYNHNGVKTDAKRFSIVVYSV